MNIKERKQSRLAIEKLLSQKQCTLSELSHYIIGIGNKKQLKLMMYQQSRNFVL